MIIFERVSRRYAATRSAGDTLRSALAFRRPAPAPAFTVLDDVSFHLARGEALGVIGRNGAGKSTLLKLLTRITRPLAGHIRVNGSLSYLLGAGAGFHMDLSGRENIYLAGAILGMSRRDITLRVDDIVAFSGVGDVLDAPVRTWSSGTCLRLAFSVGGHLDSDILVIDEALAVGDAGFQALCLARIQAFQHAGGTLVLVSHDEAQLRQVCSRGLVLERGRAVFHGDAGDALSFYARRAGAHDTPEK
ncbi:ABC transporter ATP-binding protein [Pantoea agglomerans]|uniref:ABC transporter ATP-binding protein n=1 Tax=Enterobacter agglomerans TaxID=549 RepID=UPI002413688A|nr:ABC transporter ATP-binding protein [Pantoea agglomerans]